jgi:hypothetical protein
MKLEQDTPESLSLHGVTFKNTEMLIFTVVRISNFILSCLSHKQQQIMATLRCSFVHLLSPGTFPFHQRGRSTRIPLSYDCHSSSHFQPIFYTRLWRKRKETRSRWRYVTECNHHFPSREISFWQPAVIRAGFLEISVLRLLHAIRTHAYTKVSRWRLEKQYFEDWRFD